MTTTEITAGSTKAPIKPAAETMQHSSTQRAAQISAATQTMAGATSPK
jgi:hypothetical protein